jgi:hypothetical protein
MRASTTATRNRSTIHSFVRRAAAIGALATIAETASAQVTVPDRANKPVFHGKQAEQRSPEVTFDPATGHLRASARAARPCFWGTRVPTVVARLTTR